MCRHKVLFSVTILVTVHVLTQPASRSKAVRGRTRSSGSGVKAWAHSAQPPLLLNLDQAPQV